MRRSLSSALALGFTAVHYLAEPFGSWWALVIGFSMSVAWSAALWLVRVARYAPPFESCALSA